MLHTMKLKQEPFEKIRNGTKTIELRLYDEKRQKVRTGDFIEFSLIGSSEKKLLTKVIALHCFESFQELIKTVPQEKYGYSSDETVSPDFMNEYYSLEEQAEFGVVGIEIELAD